MPTARIAVHFEHVPETDTWDFFVDEPRVIGGGCANLDEARRHAAAAIASALDEPGDGDGVENLTVAVG
ncbi:MAG: hypothetical protein WAM30_16220 [Candidatus Dormiibacterota bacterium]